MTAFERFLLKAREKYGEEYTYNHAPYIQSHKDIIIGCQTCKANGHWYLFKQKPKDHLYGRGCPECAGTRKLTRTRVIRQFREVHGSLYDYSRMNYINGTTKVTIGCYACEKRGREKWFEKKPHDHKNGRGCTVCAGYRSEQLAHDILTELGYQPRKCRPKWLLNPETGRQLELDLYLSEYKTAIEIQGVQHYHPLKFFGGETAFIEQQKRDTLKRKLCAENDVRLIEYDLRRGRDYETIKQFMEGIWL